MIWPTASAPVRAALLWCGVASSALYVAMNVFIPLQWEAYRLADQTVSELSAIGAPTRGVWWPLGLLYALLVAAFGWGVWDSAGSSRRLRVAGLLLVIYGLFGLAWPPMHQREVLAAGGKTLTDTLHLVWAAVTVLLMVLTMAVSAGAFGAAFRRYTLATIVLLATFGGLTSLDAPKVEANLPTPRIGVWERIDIGLFLAWVVVLALALLRRPRQLPDVPMRPGA
jgi:hypothetical protein